MVEINDYVPARRYVAPLVTSLWRWDDAADAIVWTEGNTIAFRQELLPVLARLAPRGLPPMNALVWLLGACRDNWPETARNLVSRAGLAASVERCDLPDWLPQLMDQLDAVHRLPAELRTLPAAKAELAAMIFEETRRDVGPDNSSRVVRVLAEYLEPGLVAPQPGRQNRCTDLLAELRLLHEGLKRFDAEAFRLRFRTGLEQAVEPADLDLEPAERTRQLIARLQDDEQLGGLARIARHMLAAIHLPRAISDREDLPVGGVSDISNRGPLDRLLSSELAHDDLTLAVRIAMNEALYFRRETPPSNPPKHRAVLLDSGLRLWGVPRVFATAVGMALAAGAQRNVRTDVFRAAGECAVPVSLADRAGVVAHMEALEPDVQPGMSLAAFAAAASYEAGLLDAVIVTGEEVAADHDFQRSLAAVELPSLLLATVSREGRFRLVSQGRRGRKLLREATLDLEKLLARPSRRQTQLIDPTAAAGLPAILTVRPFPLLLSYQPFDPARAWKAPWDGVLSISKDRCLLHWQSANRGARLVSDCAPAGAIHWTGSAVEGAVSLAVIGMLQQGALWLLRVNSASDTCQSFALDLQDGRPQAVCGHGGVIFVIYPDRADVFETVGGTKIGSTSFTKGSKSLSWRRERFFSETSQPFRWFALSYNGFEAVFEHLPCVHAEKVLAFVDVPDVEGPIGIMDDGSIFHVGNERSTPVNHGLVGRVRVAAVSRWDGAVVISDIHGLNFREVSLCHRRVGHVHGNPQDWLKNHCFDASKIVRTQPVRNRFSKIFVTDAQGRLGLVCRRSESVISLAANQQMVMQTRRSESPDKRFVATFRPAPAPPGAGYSLQVARWKDGSTAWLDSRGMLHLKSSDRSLPEVTLLLRDGYLAGWTSAGWTFGMNYFAGETEADAEVYVYHNILESFVGLLQ
jgi:hypothetical protein